MRFLTLIVAAGLLAGCAGGPDATRAKQLLDQADASHAKLSSVAYAGKLSWSVAGQRSGYELDGAAVLKGPAAGDQWLRMASSTPMPGVGSMDVSMVRRGDRLRVTSMGRTQEVPVPAGLGEHRAAWGSFASVGLASCVKKVDVEEGRSLNGEPASRIAGTIDTVCAFKLLNGAASLGQAQSAALDFDELGKHLRDARVTLFVSDRSHLLIGGVLTLTVEFRALPMLFELSYRLKSVNKPVRFPS